MSHGAAAATRAKRALPAAPVPLGATERPGRRGALPAGLAAAVARAGVDPTAAPRALQVALTAANADRRGYAGCDVDAIGWQVDLLRRERERFRGGTLEVALARCLVRPTVEEPGLGPPA